MPSGGSTVLPWNFFRTNRVSFRFSEPSLPCVTPATSNLCSLRRVSLWQSPANVRCRPPPSVIGSDRRPHHRNRCPLRPIPGSCILVWCPHMRPMPSAASPLAATFRHTRLAPFLPDLCSVWSAGHSFVTPFFRFPFLPIFCVLMASGDS